MQSSESLQVWNRWRGWNSSTLARAWRPCAPSHVPCPMHLFPMDVPEFYPFVINQQSTMSTVFLCSVSYSSKWSNLKWGPWEPLIYSYSVIRIGDNLDLSLASEVGRRIQSCEAELLTVWWHLFQVDSVKTEWIVRNPVAVGKELKNCLVGQMYTHDVRVLMSSEQGETALLLFLVSDLGSVNSPILFFFNIVLAILGLLFLQINVKISL